MKEERPEPTPAAAADPVEAARSAGLRYVTDDEPGLRRERAGEAFRYLKADGKPVQDEAMLERIRKLAIPPAWTEVWICPRADGHLQATGRDARGRKQYRYHPRFREVREETKYEHMLEFARALPAIRKAISAHMSLRGLPREKVLASVVHLLETTLIRVGNDDYAKENKSFGLTTLRDRHVSVEGGELRFNFKGKSGKTWKLQVKNRRVAKVVRACQELPGQRLFVYEDDDGQIREVTSSDVNEYLREITGRDITAKDFRTWAGTVMAALALQEVEKVDSQAAQKKNIRAAVERVAARLGNTPAICRKCYVHPEVFAAYAEGELLLEVDRKLEAQLEKSGSLNPEESAVLTLLQARLERTLEGQLEKSLVKLQGSRKK
ncbi:MAG TPA: DNA topoisomerase IB [Ramlibacter sp.]|nr:DNA topoisomerase IB [Ramlibacter sp.]